MLALLMLLFQIREKGGAYGGGAGANPLGGVFVLSSYRDPRTIETLQDFTAAAQWADSSNGTISIYPVTSSFGINSNVVILGLSDQDVQDAQLSAFKAIDAPLSPSERNARHVSFPDFTDERRQVCLLKGALTITY